VTAERKIKAKRKRRKNLNIALRKNEKLKTKRSTRTRSFQADNFLAKINKYNLNLAAVPNIGQDFHGISIFGACGFLFNFGE
jgi:hypothetical protein